MRIPWLLVLTGCALTAAAPEKLKPKVLAQQHVIRLTATLAKEFFDANKNGDAGLTVQPDAPEIVAHKIPYRISKSALTIDVPFKPFAKSTTITLTVAIPGKNGTNVPFVAKDVVVGPDAPARATAPQKLTAQVDKGVIRLTATLKPGSVEMSPTGEADLSVDPFITAITAQKVPYEISNSNLTIQVPFSPPAQKTSVTLTFWIPRNDGTLAKFVAKGVLPAAPEKVPVREALTANVHPEQSIISLTATIREDSVEMDPDGKASLSVKPLTSGITQRNVPYHISNGNLTIKVPFKPPEQQTIVTLTASIPGKNGTTISFVAKDVPLAGRPQAEGPDWVRLALFGGSAFLLCLLVSVAWKRFRPVNPPASVGTIVNPDAHKPPDNVTVPPEPDGSRDSTQAQHPATVANSKTEEMRAQKDLVTLDQVHQAIADRLAVVVGGDSELRDLATQLRPRQVRSPAVVLSGVPPEEQALLALVNHWLEGGSRDRNELRAAAQELDLDARFYTHKDVSKALMDLGASRFCFEPSEKQGGWLWVALGTGEVIALPADVAFFQIGKAPDLLDRLFEGMKGASEAFRFHRFYKACRLRQAGSMNIYEVASRGILQLDGQPPPSDAQPPDYAALVAARRGNPQEASDVSLANSLRTFITEVADRLQGQETAIQTVSDQLSTRASSNLTEMRNRAEALEQKVEGIESQVRRVAADIGALPAATSPAPPIAASVKEEPVQSTPAPAVPPETAPVPATAPQAAPPASPPPPPTVITVPPDPANERIVPQPDWYMPPGWQQAMREACRLAAGGAEESADSRTYLWRLSLLRKTLAGLEQGVVVRIVHLKNEDDSFYVHDIDSMGEEAEEVRCKECASMQSWQLVVGLGERDGMTLSVLLPLGAVYPSKYADGYDNLMENFRNSQFHIREVQQPARLRKNDRGVYTVPAKMVWSER